MKKIAAYILICVLSLSCAVITAAYRADLSRQYKADRSYLYVRTVQAADGAEPDEDYVMGTYSIKEGQTVSLGGINNKTAASVVTVDFTLGNMLGAAVNLLEDDTYGCVVSSGLAGKLFGSLDVIGCAVGAGGEEYVVRSVVDSDEMFVIVQEKVGAESRQKEINGAVIDVSGEAYKGQYLTEYCARHGLDSTDCYYASDYLGIVPKTELPAKWSDFDGWEEAAGQWKNVSDRMTFAEKDIIELCYYNVWIKMRRCVLCILAMAALFAVSFVKCTKKLIKNY